MEKPTRRFLAVCLPEDSEGSYVDGYLFFDLETTDLETVKAALKGKSLGVMGGDLPDEAFKVVTTLSPDAVRNLSERELRLLGRAHDLLDYYDWTD